MQKNIIIVIKKDKFLWQLKKISFYLPYQNT